MVTSAAVARPPVLRSRPLAALLVAEVLSTTGSQMTWLALPWFVLTTTGSAKQMALVIAAETGGYVVFGIPSGSVLDRLGAQRTMRLCDAVRAPLMVLVPMLHWTGHLTLPTLAAIAFVLGTASTPYMAAQRVVVAEILDEDEASVERANALLQGANRITSLAGPALGGILIAAVGASVVLVVDAASYVVAVVLVTLFVPIVRKPREDEAEDSRGLLAGVRYIFRDPLLRGWTTAILVGDASFSVIFLAIPVLVYTQYGADPRLAGALLAAWGVGAVAGNLIVYRSDRVGGLRQAAWIVLLQAAPLWALAGPVPAAAVGAALALSGFANGLVNPTLHAVLTLRPPQAVRAKALTAMSTSSALAMPIALAVAGSAFAAYGSRHVVAAAAAGQLVAMSYAAFVTLRFLARERA